MCVKDKWGTKSILEIYYGQKNHDTLLTLSRICFVIYKKINDTHDIYVNAYDNIFD